MSDKDAQEWAEAVLGMEESTMPAPPNATGTALDREIWTERLGGVFEALHDGPDIAPPEAVWRAIDAALGPPVMSRMKGEGEWFAVAPGARMRMLMVDPPSGHRTSLLRLEPGTIFPAHDHEQLEECLVLEGDITVDGREYRAGDYVIAGARTEHREIPTREGALVMLRWA